MLVCRNRRGASALRHPFANPSSRIAAIKLPKFDFQPQSRDYITFFTIKKRHASHSGSILLYNIIDLEFSTQDHLILYYAIPRNTGQYDNILANFLRQCNERIIDHEKTQTYQNYAKFNLSPEIGFP